MICIRVVDPYPTIAGGVHGWGRLLKHGKVVSLSLQLWIGVIMLASGGCEKSRMSNPTFWVIRWQLPSCWCGGKMRHMLNRCSSCCVRKQPTNLPLHCIAGRPCLGEPRRIWVCYSACSVKQSIFGSSCWIVCGLFSCA